MSLSDALPPGADVWHHGWYAPAQALASPNFGPRPVGARVDLVVVHSISLPPGVYGGPEVPAFFANQLDWNAHPYFETIRGLQVSAHFFIRRHGQLLQCVSCNDRAWHAGPSTYRGRDNCNDDSIGVELEGLEGGIFEEVQYRVLGALIAAIGIQYPLAHVAGHEHIAPGRKNDPGPGFDWDHLRELAGFPADALPPR